MKKSKYPKYTIEQKIKDLHKAIVNGDKETADRLQKEIDYFEYGIKNNSVSLWINYRPSKNGSQQRNGKQSEW